MLRINPELISCTDASSQFDAGQSIAREYTQIHADGEKELDELEAAAVCDAQREYLAARRESWEAFIVEAASEVLRRRAAWVPVNVAGPARYNVRKESAKADRFIDTEREYIAKIETFRKNTRDRFDELKPLEDRIAEYRAGRRTAISSDDPHAAELIRAKLEHMQEIHAANVAANAYYRQNKTLDGFSGPYDVEYIGLYQTYGAAERVPFPAFHLQNELAEIKRLSDRLADLEKLASRGAAEDFSIIFDLFTLKNDTAANRLQLIFDGKPDDATREKLRAAALKWSPKAKAWQRQTTRNAVREIIRLIRELGAKKPEPFTPEEAAFLLNLEAAAD